VSCGGCGNDLRLSTDPDLAHLWQANDELVCWGCVVSEVLKRIESRKPQHTDEDPKSLAPHYLEGRSFTARLLDAAPTPPEEVS
jgi:hypothetical protein